MNSGELDPKKESDSAAQTDKSDCEPGWMAVSEFIELLAEVYGREKLLNRLLWLDNLGLVACNRAKENENIYLNQLQGWPDCIKPGKCRISQSNMEATYWLAGESQFPWKNQEGVLEWMATFKPADHPQDLEYMALSHFTNEFCVHPIDDVDKTRNSRYPNNAVNEPWVWLLMEYGRNKGHFVDWNHWFRIRKWNASQAACLLYSVDPFKWGPNSKARKGYNDIDFRVLAERIEKLTSLAQQDLGEATPKQWADWVRDNAQEDLSWKDINPRFKAFLEASENRNEHHINLVSGQDTKKPKSKNAKRTRIDRLNRAIIAALQKNGSSKTANELFDWLADNDETGTIVDSTSDKLIWEDSQKKCHDIDRSTFANRVSKLRKKGYA